MAHWNSGDRDKTEHLTSRVIPLLAIAGVGLVLLYGVLIMLGFHAFFLIEWLIAMGLLVFCARAVLADYRLLTRKAFFFSFALGVPLVIIGFSAILRSMAFTLHAFVLFALCAVGWTLLESIVAQCTGHTDTMNAERQQRTMTGRQYEALKIRGLAFSGDGLMALVLVGTAIFSVGDYLRMSQGVRIIPALPFALLFYVIVGGLASLSKLVQRMQETPGAVRLESGFARTWAGVMITVLLIFGLLAYFLPKSPVIGTGSWMVAHARSAQDEEDALPQFEPLPEGNSSTVAPFGGHGTQPTPGVGRVPGATSRGSTPDQQVVDLMDKIATAFESDQPSRKTDDSPNSGKRDGTQGSDGTHPGRGSSQHNGSDQNRRKGGSSPASGSGHAKVTNTPQTGAQPKAHPPAQNNIHKLKLTLHGRPDRLLKLLLALLLAVLALGGVVFVLVRLIRRHIGSLLVTLSKQLWEWLAEKVQRRLAPFLARLEAKRREARILRLMEDIHPFLDPFADSEGRSGTDIARAVYASFLAHVWLLGYERRTSETDFMFATRLCDHTDIDAQSIQAIAMGNVRAEFSPTPLGDDELAQLRAAHQQVVTAITARIHTDMYAEKTALYRRLLAERKLERENAREIPLP